MCCRPGLLLFFLLLTLDRALSKSDKSKVSGVLLGCRSTCDLHAKQFNMIKDQILHLLARGTEERLALITFLKFIVEALGAEGVSALW